MILNSFVFFDQSSTTSTSNSLSLPSNASSILLQVELLDESSSVAISVEGNVDFNMPNSYHELKVINMSNLQAVNTITSPGIYTVVVSGLGKVRLVSENSVGKFKAYGTVTD